jgi:hypothetical protein
MQASDTYTVDEGIIAGTLITTHMYLEPFALHHSLANPRNENHSDSQLRRVLVGENRKDRHPVTIKQY